MNRTMAGRWLTGLAGAAVCLAPAVRGEDITVSTYYPSPRGVYDELRANTVVLRDSATGKSYSLTVHEGKLLVTDLEKHKAFILLEVPETPLP